MRSPIHGLDLLRTSTPTTVHFCCRLEPDSCIGSFGGVVSLNFLLSCTRQSGNEKLSGMAYNVVVLTAFSWKAGGRALWRAHKVLDNVDFS